MRAKRVERIVSTDEARQAARRRNFEAVLEERNTDVVPADLVSEQSDPRLRHELLGVGTECEDASHGRDELALGPREETAREEHVVRPRKPADGAQVRVHEPGVQITARSADDRCAIEECLALVVSKLSRLDRAQAAVLVANPQKDLAARVLVDVLAGFYFDDQEVVGAAPAVDAG